MDYFRGFTSGFQMAKNAGILSPAPAGKSVCSTSHQKRKFIDLVEDLTR